MKELFIKVWSTTKLTLLLGMLALLLDTVLWHVSSSKSFYLGWTRFLLVLLGALAYRASFLKVAPLKITSFFFSK